MNTMGGFVGKVKKIWRKWIGAFFTGSALLYVIGTQTGLHVLNVVAVVFLLASLAEIVRRG